MHTLLIATVLLLIACAGTQQNVRVAPPPEAVVQRNDQAERTPVAPPSLPMPPAAPFSPVGYTFDQNCIRADDGQLAVQVVITAHYTCAEPTACIEPQTTLWQWYCDAAGDCVGIEASRLTPGRPIGVADLNRIGGEGSASVVSRTGDVVIIKWGPLRTFTVDFATGVVSYRESGTGLLTDAHVNGRGESSCRVGT